MATTGENLNSYDPGARGAVAQIFYTNLVKCVLSLLGPACILYLAMYMLVKRKIRVFEKLSWICVVAFFMSTFVVDIGCSSVKSLQLFGVAIGIMKALDLFVRRRAPPQYASEDRPSDAVVAWYLMTELRYESFVPNHIRTAPAPSAEKEPVRRNVNCNNVNSLWCPRRCRWIRKLEFSERANLVIHAGVFFVLQFLFPQSNPTVLVAQILLAIYVIWESLELALRYHNSPPLFGPIYKASSLASFWSETWHCAFASPCRSLAYGPVRRNLLRWGVPVPFARAIGILASFALMGIFHVYALTPLLPIDALFRICAFFLLNGIGTVMEDAVWGRHSHWGKALLAWVFELFIASWTVEGLSVPKGLRNITWGSI